MALHWRWEDKVGEAVIRQQGDKEYTMSLYEGNAFLIMLWEWEEDGEEKWNMYTFFADEQHMKNCLGLNKKGGYENIFDGRDELVKIRINKAKYHYTEKLVKALVKAFDNITIEIYKE